ncbi:MAG: hypothetical protein AB8E82_20225 [Aureispira sp.]
MFLNKWFSTCILFVISCFFSATLWAQTTLEDVVYLKNGSIIRGQVLEYDPSANVKIQIKGGSILVYASSEVTKMEKVEVKTEKEPTNTTVIPLEIIESGENTNKVIWEQHVPAKGMYGTASVGNTLPSRGSFIPLPGFTLDGTIGYRIHHAFAPAIGVGTMFDFTQSFVYTYASIKGDILNKSFSPYYLIDVGYGAPLSTFAPVQRGDVQEVTVMQGGLFMRPSIGFRFASRNKIHTFLDIGVHIQNVYYEGRTWNNFTYTEQYTYIRPSIRVGMTF